MLRFFVVLAFAAVCALAAVLAVALRTDAEPRSIAPVSELDRASVEDDSALRAPADASVRQELAPAPAAAALRVEGRVLDDHGASAAGAAVWITYLDARSTDTAAWSVARGDGSYVLDAERDAFVVHACGLACGEGARAVNVDAGVRSVHVDDLLLPRGGVIRGRVLDVRGKGIEYLRVESWARQGPVWETAIQGHVISAGFRRVMTDADGRFELAGLRTCMHRIVLQLEGRTARWDATERDGVLPDGEELVFRQLPDGVLRGRVVDAETNAPLTVFTVDDERHEDAGGSFEVPFALFEPVFVEAEGHGGNLWWRAPDELHMETVEHVFALERQRPVAEPPSARLTVRAIDERGVPVKGVRLRRIWGKRPDLGLIEEALGELVPDSRGDGEALLVPRVALGREVGIDAPGHAFTREALDRRRDEDQTLELVLERGASVAVRLRDELGLVARDVQFELDSAKRKEREFLSWSDGNTVRLGRTDSAEPFSVTAGELRIEGLPAGRYTLIARFGEDRNASFEFEVHAEEPRSYDFQFTPR